MNLLYTYTPTDLSREWLKKDFQEIFLKKSIEDSLGFYDNIIFYTDDNFAKKINNKKINIEIVKETVFNKELWALPKIQTYEKQDTEFIHIDLDVILGHKPDFKEVLLESEEKGEYFKKMYPLDNTVGISYNMGVYGCKNLSFNVDYCKEAYLYIERNYETFKKRGILRFMPIYFEQLMMAKTLKLKNIIPDLIENENYVHLKDKKWDVKTYKIYKI